MRSPRYPSTGDTIHADPETMISIEGRTFSIFLADNIEMCGQISSVRNGLLFYDNDREIFLHRPVFPDLLSTSLTPLQVGVINEFSRIRTWEQFGKFLLKIDKTLILDQFRQYISPDDISGKNVFYLRAKEFCQRENIALTDDELLAPDALRTLALAISEKETLKSSFFVSSVPDIQLAHPDPALCQAQTQKRASRWLNLATKDKSIDPDLKKQIDKIDKKAAIRLIVAKYMDTVDKWEGSPLMKTKDGGTLSRADVEDSLTGSATVYCPSPLGWTPRLRFAFYCPKEFKDEPVDVKIEVIAALERKIGEESGLDVKLLYIPEQNCLVLEGLAEGGGGAQVPCTFENGQMAETEILNLENNQLASLSRAIMSAKESMLPSQMEIQIENARMALDEMRMRADMPYDDESMNTWENMEYGENQSAEEGLSM